METRQQAQARRIRPNRRSLTGSIPVKGRAVPFESSLERDLLVLLDFDEDVASVAAQPYTLSFAGPGGERRRYTPDFRVRRHSGPPTVYEVKYRQELRERWPDLKPRFRAAARDARQRGLRFEVVTEVEIRGPRLENARFLRPYLDRRPDAGTESRLLDAMTQLGTAKPGDILNTAFPEHASRSMALPSLWRLVALGRIAADLDAPLTMATPLRAVGEDGRP
ncbi:TnsA endonuclease C terminal [Limimonas halophila]|uniref:TnsA endonuclease C terminal n=1 Tax=Limimonas halophila TaxID=1082479 RepID=A0A1G7SST9_9PROT|nr:TnsA endonuclease N-terminal domain-containing protein [Limimonas halophila]SDG25942.1 TnsA endonuclease C terminal [Limimonas halophila]